MNATRWLNHVMDAIATLEHMPRRYAVAEEDDFRSYEIRRILVGDYQLLFTIDDDQRTVAIIGFRHGGMLPRDEDLPG